MSQTKKNENPGDSQAGGDLSHLSTDLKHIEKLIHLMVDNDVSKLELREGDTHVLLRRGGPAVAVPMVTGPAPAPVAGGAVPAHPTPAANENETLIRSPMVGTAFVAPDPESPPFVSVGTEIAADTVVCLIEAMKVFNEIKAEVSGRVARVLFNNGEAVEFDQPLFAISPA